MGRAPCCEKVGLKKGRWSAQEDEILTKYIQANGEGSWRSLPKNAGLLRCGKSCRLRWINYLRADLKRGNISAQEEEIIIKLHASVGNRWSLIASHLAGRTDNEIKNYWNSHLSRKIYALRRPGSTDQTQPVATMDIQTPKANNIATKRKEGRTSRWAMKKNRNNSQKATERPKESTVTNQSSIAAVPVPHTPALENEGFSIAIEDFMVLEGDTEDKVERAEVGEPSYEEGSGDGLFRWGGDKETETVQECQEGIIDGGEVLCFNDIVDNCLLEDDGGGLLTLSDERERNDEVTCPNNKMATGEEPENATGEWYSSMASVFEFDYWDNWESIVEQLNDHNESESWEDKQNLLSWLWQVDDWESDSQITGQIDPESQNSKLPSFLS